MACFGTSVPHSGQQLSQKGQEECQADNARGHTEHGYECWPRNIQEYPGLWKLNSYPEFSDPWWPLCYIQYISQGSTLGLLLIERLALEESLLQKNVLINVADNNYHLVLFAVVWGIHSEAWIPYPWTPRNSQFEIGPAWLGCCNLFDLAGHCGEASFVVRWMPFIYWGFRVSRSTHKETTRARAFGNPKHLGYSLTIRKHYVVFPVNSTQLSLDAFPSQLPEALSLLRGHPPPCCWLPTVYWQAIHSVIVDQGM